MFVDASVLCALLAKEVDAAFLYTRLESGSTRITSPMAVWEASISLTRIMKIVPSVAHEFVRDECRRHRSRRHPS